MDTFFPTKNIFNCIFNIGSEADAEYYSFEKFQRHK